MFDPISLALVIGTAALAGVLAGLLGIGGGVVIVPALLLVFTRAGVDPQVKVQLAVGTSLATIVFTSVSSAWSHHRRGAMHLRLALGFLPGLVVGSVGGVLVAVEISGDLLQLLFGIFLYIVAARMVFGHLPDDPQPRAMGFFTRLLAGLIIGGVSTMVGIGGGVLSVPVLVLAAGLTIHHAVGTSPGLGLVLSLVGTITFVLRGLGEPGLPDGSLGYVALGPAAIIAAGTVTLAPLGAWLAHRTPKRALSLAFAVLLTVVGSKLVLDAAGVRRPRPPTVAVQLQGYAELERDGRGDWVPVFRQGSPILMSLTPDEGPWETMPVELSMAAWVVAPSLDRDEGERRPLLVNYPSCLSANCEVGAELAMGALTAAIPSGRGGIPQEEPFFIGVAAWSVGDEETEAWVLRHAEAARYPDSGRRGVWLEQLQVVVSADGRWGDGDGGAESAQQAARLVEQGEHAAGARMFTRAASEADALPVRAASLHRNAAVTWSRAGDPEQAWTSAGQALAIDGAHGNVVGEARDRMTLALLHVRSGELAAALDQLHEAAAGWRRLGRHGEEAEALIELAAVERTLGHYGRGLDALERAQPWLESSLGSAGERAGNGAWADHLLLMADTQLRARQLGQRDVARDEVSTNIHQALELCQASGSRTGTARGYLSMARLALQEGDLEQARDHLDAASSLLGRDQELATHHRAVEAELALALGDGEAALERTRDPGLLPPWWVCHVRGRALALLGRTDEALAEYEESLGPLGSNQVVLDLPVRAPWVPGDPELVLQNHVTLLVDADRPERALEVSEWSRMRQRWLETGATLDGGFDPSTTDHVLDELGSALADGSMALLYHVTTDEVIVFAVRPGGELTVHRRALPRRQLTEIVQWHLQGIESGGDGRASPDLVPTTLPADLFLELTTTLVFVPHGPLLDVPFAVIDYGERFLIQEHVVVMAPSATEFVTARRTRHDAEPSMGTTRWEQILASDDGHDLPSRLFVSGVLEGERARETTRATWAASRDLIARDVGTVLVQWWSVDPDVAREVENRVLADVEEHGPAEALRRAQVALLQGEAGEEGALPRSWGAFAVIGDPG